MVDKRYREVFRKSFAWEVREIIFISEKELIPQAIVLSQAVKHILVDVNSH